MGFRDFLAARNLSAERLWARIYSDDFRTESSTPLRVQMRVLADAMASTVFANTVTTTVILALTVTTVINAATVPPTTATVLTTTAATVFTTTASTIPLGFNWEDPAMAEVPFQRWTDYNSTFAKNYIFQGGMSSYIVVCSSRRKLSNHLPKPNRYVQ